MSHGDRQMVELSSSRTRRRSPEPFERNVRQKTDFEVPATSLNHTQEVEVRGDEEYNVALAHIIHGTPEDPMHQRHVNYILRRMSAKLFDATRQPLAVIQSISTIGAAASEAKKSAAKELLTERWLDRILEHVGEIMRATDQEGVVVENDFGHHRLQLKVVPIVQVDDTQTIASEEDRSREGLRQLLIEDDGGGEDEHEDGTGNESDVHSDNGSSEAEHISISDTDQEDNGIDVSAQVQLYQPGRTQVFVCNHVPKGYTCETLLELLANTISEIGQIRGSRCYVMRSKKTKPPAVKAWVVVVLDRITNAANFTVHNKGQHLHFRPYFGGENCSLCGQAHLLVECNRFSPMIPPRNKYQGLYTIVRPRLLAAFRR